MSDTTAIALPPIFDISSVSDVKSSLLVSLSTGDPVSLDGAPTQRVDAAALQLLFAFRAEAAQRAVTVEWVAASGTILEAARQTGMVEALGLEACAAK